MSYIKSINKNAVIIHEPRKEKMTQSSKNTREDLKITFTNNEAVKSVSMVSMINNKFLSSQSLG